MLVGKSRGGTPFCRTLKTVFPKSRIFCKAFSLQLFHRNSCKIFVFDSGFTRRSGLVRPASKSGRFSHHPLRVPETWHRDFAACGQRSGLLALNLASIFEKLLHRKTFVRLRLVLGIPPESGSARLGHIPSLPWESQLPLKPCISLHPSDFEGNCDSLRFSPRFLLHFIVQFHLLRKCGLLAHTSPAFLKNCWIKKLFRCLRLVICN